MRRRLAILTALLLLGAALRLHGLNTMQGMVHYDEAYYGVDALSLVAQPRFTPFFPANFGRESLWMYLLAPSLAIFGGGSFGLRIVAIFTGVLTLAAVYRLARELVGRRGALWSLAALAVLFWHVLASHEAFRALLFPLVGALAFAFLWSAQRQAHRRGAMRLWIVGGVLLGLLFYTYLAARVWLALAALTLLWWFARQPRVRRGVLLAGLIALVICLPLIVYLVTNPAVAGERVEQVAISDWGMLLNNVGAWLGVWFAHGADDVVYNLPGRPLLDLPLGVLFVAGIAALVFRLRRDRTVWLVLLAGASIAPALLTTEPLKWLRAIGLNVPLAILLGAGALMVERMVRWFVVRRGDLPGRPYTLAILPAVLLVFAGGDTLRDFDRWVNSPDLFLPMEQHIYAGIDWLADHAPAGAPVYFSPFSLDHPVLRLREWRLGAHPVGAFDAVSCLAIPNAPAAYYFDLTMYDAGFADRLGQWAQVEAVDNDPGGGRDTIFRAVPQPGLFTGAFLDFGSGLIGARPLSALPSSAAPGTTVAVTFGLRALRPVDRAYTLFVHLYQGTALDRGIQLISQTDQPICPSDPPTVWRSDELIAQTYTLPIPPTLAPGRYTLAFGIYDSASVTRLPVGSTDYAVLETIDVK